MAFDAGVRMTDTVNFLGLQFSGLDLAGALDAICARASLNLPFGYVATPNVDHVVGLANEPGRRTLYDSSWLLLNDSRVLKSLARKAKISLPVAPGSDIAEHLFDTVIDKYEPVTIIGGDRDSIEELKRVYDLRDVRWHEPPMGVKLKPGAVVRAAAFRRRSTVAVYVHLRWRAAARNDCLRNRPARRCARRWPLRRLCARLPLRRRNARPALDAGDGS